MICAPCQEQACVECVDVRVPRAYRGCYCQHGGWGSADRWAVGHALARHLGRIPTLDEIAEVTERIAAEAVPVGIGQGLPECHVPNLGGVTHTTATAGPAEPSEAKTPVDRDDSSADEDLKPVPTQPGPVDETAADPWDDVETPSLLDIAEG